MKFGVFYELQYPKPWTKDGEHRLFKEALDQLVLADKLGIDYAWEVEHHFLEEYSHSSAPEVFLGAAASLTKNIRLGHGIKHVIPAYSHPARNAECIATLDLVSDGRVEFGFGEGATRSELAGFGIKAKTKRKQALEAVEQMCNMMAMSPYPGFESDSFSLPCRNVLPKPLQTPHPPLWMACTNPDTIKLAATLGVGALTFAFKGPEVVEEWVKLYYDTLKSDECVPIGHSVNANLAVVSDFSIHPDRAEAIRRGLDNIDFFRYAINALVAMDTKPGYTRLWEDFKKIQGDKAEQMIKNCHSPGHPISGIGTPDDIRQHLKKFEAAGADQVILMQQSGHAKHEHICESMELFASEVMPEFKTRAAAHSEKRQKEMAPYIEAAMARKQFLKPMEEHEVNAVTASVKTSSYTD